MENRTLLECDNVNGVRLSLKMLTGNIPTPEAPRAREFVINFKNQRTRTSTSWAKTSLFIAIIFNIVVFSYIRISLTACAYIVLIFSFLTYFWVSHSVQLETLLIVPTVGIQSTVQYVWGKEYNFISWNSIDDVIINEAITMNRVLFFLTVLVKANSESNNQDTVKLIPMFQHTKPRLVMLEKVYSEIQTFIRDFVKDQAEASGDNG